MIINDQEILEAAHLEEVISQYVDLKRRGQNLVGCCPFHDEKTPSFSVSTSKGVYKCFGCGEGGTNGASFLMKLKDVTYPEAIEMLSAVAKIPVEWSADREKAIEESRARKTKIDEQTEVMKAAYAIIMTQNKDLYDKETVTIAGKEYSQKTIKKWQMAIHPESGISLFNDLDPSTLLDVGMINKSQKGNLYDFFYGRVLFPIHDRRGNIVGINGRVLDVKPDKSVPKYINTKDTEIFQKGKSLYGLYINGATIRDRGQAYIVEGPTDVVMMDEHGIGNAVAPMGTALTLDQVKVLATYTDRVVVMTDGDKAGKVSAMKSVDVLMQCQMEVAVLELPDGDDPASFLMNNGAEAFKAYSDEHHQDGVLWRVSQELSKDPSPHEKANALNVAANLLCHLDSQTLVTSYSKTVSKLIGVTIKIVTDAIGEQRDLKLEGKKKLTTEQENDKMKYGVYVDRHKYYDFFGTELSNFVLQPIFLIRDGEKSYRVFDMINTDKISYCLIVDSDHLTQLGSFRKVSEKYGNYLFFGNDSNFIKVRNLIYSDMDKVYQLPYLGYINQTGVYAWGNGITTPEGDWIPVDEYGRVDYKDISYFMPAYSKLKTQEVVSDKDESDYEHQFTYHKNSEVNFETWVKDMYEMFGANGLIGMAYYFAAQHRDYVQTRYNNFPILNLFGPPGSGKSTMAKMWHSLYGMPINPVHCVTATWSSFFRRPAQTKNAMIHYEEYSEKVEQERQEGLKGFFDGFGRPLAKKETSNKVESMPVHSAIILSGQVLPTHDPALLERCITLFFEVLEYTDRQRKIYERYKNYASKGYLSTITAYLHKYRDRIIAAYDEKYQDVAAAIKQQVRDSDVNDRVMTSFTMIATFYACVSEIVHREDKYSMPQDYLVYDAIVDRIKTQVKVNEGATELNEFWNMLEYMIDQESIDGNHYEVLMQQSVTINDGKHTDNVQWEQPHKVLYLKLNTVHKEYLRNARSQGVVRTLDMNSIKYYLSIHKGYIGQTVRKINNKTTRMWAFDMAYLNIDLEDTLYRTDETADMFGPVAGNNDFEEMKKHRK